MRKMKGLFVLTFLSIIITPAGSFWWSVRSELPALSSMRRICRLASRNDYTGPKRACTRLDTLAKAELQKGLRLALAECQRATLHHRWNCSAKAPSFGNLLYRNTMEAAFLYAMSAAAVAYQINRACDAGEYFCPCRHEENLYSYRFSGCKPEESQNFGMSVSRWMTSLRNNNQLSKSSAFGLAAEPSRHQQSSRPKRSRRDHRHASESGDDNDLVNRQQNSAANHNRVLRRGRAPAHSIEIGFILPTAAGPAGKRQQGEKDLSALKTRWTGLDEATIAFIKHNANIGRKVLRQTAQRKCTCIGLTAGCASKACWTTLGESSWRRVPGNLLQAMKKAVQVEMPPSSSTNRVAAVASASSEVSRLLYENKSPDFCVRNVLVGSEGTWERQCNSSAVPSDLSSCHHICCDRGHRPAEVQRSEKCRCQLNDESFQVRCDRCSVTSIVDICQ